MKDKYIIDDTLRNLPYGLLMALLIWGALIGQLTWQAKKLKPLNVEFINLQSPVIQVIVPKPFVPQMARKLSGPVQLPSKQTSSRTQPPAVSTPAMSLSETDLPANSKATSDTVQTGLPGLEKHAIVSVKASEGPATPPQFG